MRLATRGLALVTLCAVFVGTRACVFRLGIRSSDELVQMHTLDPDLLSGDLLRSLFYLHAQPPLFNALLGSLLKVAPRAFPWAMSITYWLLGALLMLAMFRLLRRSGISSFGATLATLLFVSSPACLLYETFNLYIYPVAVLFLVAAWAAHRYFVSGRARDAFLLSTLLTVLALLWSLLHLLWLTAAILLVAALRRPTKRAGFALGLPPLAVVLLYLKNLVLFGFFGASSLLGLNLYRISTELLPRAERLRLVEEGVLSPFALYGVNHPAGSYPGAAADVAGIDFGSAESRSLLPWGWADRPEDSLDGRFLWSLGDTSVLVLPGTPTWRTPEESLTLTLRCAPLRFTGLSAQTIEVFANGHPVDRFTLTDEPADHRVRIPRAVLRDTWNILTFRYAYAKRPSELGLGADSRRLAVRWLDITLDPPFRFSGLASEERTTGVPALDRVRKLDGGVNLNHAIFPAIHRQFQHDALRVIRRDPGLYVRAAARAALIFLAPPQEAPTLRVKRRAITAWERFYTAWIYGAPDPGPPSEHSHDSRWRPTRELLARVSWLSLAFAAIFIPWQLRQALREPRTADNAAFLFACFNLVFIAVASSCFEYGENNRFRMMVEPLFWFLLVVAGHRCLSALRARRAARTRRFT